MRLTSTPTLIPTLTPFPTPTLTWVRSSGYTYYDYTYYDHTYDDYTYYDQVKWPPKPRSIKPVLVERGPGFNGEVSFIDRQAGAGEPGRAAKVRAIASQLVEGRLGL